MIGEKIMNTPEKRNPLGKYRFFLFQLLCYFLL